MIEVASRRAIAANHLTILVPIFTKNNQRFVNEHSNQPAPKSALVVELRWIARSCKPTTFRQHDRLARDRRERDRPGSVVVGDTDRTSVQIPLDLLAGSSRRFSFTCISFDDK